MTRNTINRSYKYRLYPNRKQIQSLEDMLEAHRQLYNAALQERRQHWKEKKVSINWYYQNLQIKEIRREIPEFSSCNFSSLQQTLRRLDKAFKAFFRRVKSGETPGYPRFKSKSRFRSISFTFGDGATLRNSRLRIQNVGMVKVKWHRPIPENATIKRVVIKRIAINKWYVTFQLELPLPIPKEHTGQPVGIDLGLLSFVALSNGKQVQAPRYLRKSERKLRKQQRRLSRRKKGSSRRNKARIQVAKTHARIANQRMNFTHKLSRKIADEFSLIAVEKLNVQGMGKNHHLAKSIHDTGWSTFVNNLSYKAEGAGGQVVKVNPHYTSQICSGCGCIVKKSLIVRVHNCPDCGLVIDRDVNAARNILTLALSARTERSGANVGVSIPSVV